LQVVEQHYNKVQKARQEEDQLRITLEKLNNHIGDLSGSDTDTSINTKSPEDMQISEEEILPVKMTSAQKSSIITHNDSITNDDLDDLVRQNLPPIIGNEDEEWFKVESKKSPLRAISTETPKSVLEDELFIKDIEKKMHLSTSTPRKDSGKKIVVESESSDNDDQNEYEKFKKDVSKSTSGAKQADFDIPLVVVTEDIIAPVESFRDDSYHGDDVDQQEPEDPADNYDYFTDFVREHRTVLPSFEINELETKQKEVDLDDISHISSEDSYPENDRVMSLDGSLHFGNNWSLTNRFSGGSFISAYDNFGSKKLGREGSEPTLMLVPKADDEISVAKIGDMYV
jgi:hypothetical protein